MTPTNVVPGRQLDPAISSLANPSTTTRLMDTDNPDHSSSNDRETNDWPIDSKTESLVVLMDHELFMDEYMLEDYNTDSNSGEEEEVQDEQQQQQQQQDEEEEEAEQSEFIMPKIPSKNKKLKDLPRRRQKGRTCKSTSKSYNEDFSDDTDI